ncbi:uncharacterized protein LOC110716141 [Chenopodium quinoa]|uniref:uncharacterized protein LOC110716141 n=1 Tax=Chenopodium quinoa TaxID=63459 RepID=UPI000B777A75|nr:uncharacterized protein LOC110716141 [Chenopodium quinoa]
MAAEIPYPPGFYAETPTDTFHFFTHTKNSVPEMNFKDYVYFISDNGFLTKQVVDYEILRVIVAKPLERQGLLKKMMMMSSDGAISPSHLPNISDVVALAEVQQVIRELEDEEPENEGITPIIPKKLVSLIDPNPVLRHSCPIYTIGKKFHCEFGSYSDDIVYAHV